MAISRIVGEIEEKVTVREIGGIIILISTILVIILILIIIILIIRVYSNSQPSAWLVQGPAAQICSYRGGESLERLPLHQDCLQVPLPAYFMENCKQIFFKKGCIGKFACDGILL